MILRLTPTPAALVGETPAEWHFLEWHGGATLAVYTDPPYSADAMPSGFAPEHA
jgi:hypothetical protein